MTSKFLDLVKITWLGILHSNVNLLFVDIMLQWHVKVFAVWFGKVWFLMLGRWIELFQECRSSDVKILFVESLAALWKYRMAQTLQIALVSKLVWYFFISKYVTINILTDIHTLILGEASLIDATLGAFCNSLIWINYNTCILFHIHQLWLEICNLSHVILLFFFQIFILLLLLARLLLKLMECLLLIYQLLFDLRNNLLLFLIFFMVCYNPVRLFL